MSAIASITEDKREAIEELRERLKADVEPETCEDILLLYKFLKAQAFNVNNAESMLRKHLEWRKKIDVENVSMPEVLQKYFPYVFVGYAKGGYVVRYTPLGNIDIIGVLNSIKFEDIEKALAFMVEDDNIKLKEQSKKLGRSVNKCVYIYNLENITFRKITDKKAILSSIVALNCFQNNFPGQIKDAYIINGSVYVTIIYNILKRILTARILNKIHFYYDDSWKEDLLKVIDADVLPAFLGGNRTDPDGNPLCHSIINHGEPVPEKYYIHRSKRSLSSMDGVKKISLANASFHEETLEVKVPGSYLEWEFETKCRDIGFGIFYQDVIDGEEKMIEIIPIQRIDTEEYSETGTYLCEKVGKYVVLFDNSYSWIRAKEIFFRIKIVTPEEQESQLENS